MKKMLAILMLAGVMGVIADDFGPLPPPDVEGMPIPEQTCLPTCAIYCIFGYCFEIYACI